MHVINEQLIDPVVILPLYHWFIFWACVSSFDLFPVTGTRLCKAGTIFFQTAQTATKASLKYTEEVCHPQSII